VNTEILLPDNTFQVEMEALSEIDGLLFTTHLARFENFAKVHLDLSFIMPGQRKSGEDVWIAQQTPKSEKDRNYNAMHAKVQQEDRDLRQAGSEQLDCQGDLQDPRAWGLGGAVRTGDPGRRGDSVQACPAELGGRCPQSRGEASLWGWRQEEVKTPTTKDLLLFRRLVNDG
jgi:hypothetical protein